MTDKLKNRDTMTAGVTASRLEEGKTITLHDHQATITSTDDQDTTVQYANLARRSFDTHVLNSYLELGTFPVGTEFQRPGAVAFIEAVTGNAGYELRIVTDTGSHHETLPYESLIAWHMMNMPIRKPVPEASPAADRTPETVPDDTDLFESDLRQEVESLRVKLAKANRDAEAAEINGQTRINALLREIGDLKAELLKQHDLHTTELLAKNAEIERLEEKSSIFNPPKAKKEVLTLIQPLRQQTEVLKATDLELADKLNADWEIVNVSVNTCFWQQEAIDGHIRIVTLSRDLPAAPAPKVIATDQAIYSGTVSSSRMPVQQPRIPITPTVIMGQGEPVNRALTRNRRKLGDTKPISRASMQRTNDASVFQDILDRNVAARTAILNKPSRPFGQQ